MSKLLASLLLSIALLIPITSEAADPWSDQDIALEGAVVAISVLDMMQTHYIVDHSQYYEVNPMLGQHPSHTDVTNYFLLSIAAHITLVNYLPAKGWRPTVQIASIISEGYVTVTNSYLKIGLSSNF